MIKKVIFWILLVLDVILNIRIATILILDLDRLTEYGLGYLVGLLILDAIILTIVIIIGKKVFRKDENKN